MSHRDNKYDKFDFRGIINALPCLYKHGRASENSHILGRVYCHHIYCIGIYI